MAQQLTGEELKQFKKDLTELNNYLQHILKPTIKLNKKAIVKLWLLICTMI